MFGFGLGVATGISGLGLSVAAGVFGLRLGLVLVFVLDDGLLGLVFDGAVEVEPLFVGQGLG